jgi:outer membrane protein W
MPRGSIEGLLEYSNSVVTEGWGNYITGGTLLLRYNFEPEGSKWSPYIQAGCGIVATDAYKDEDQDIIGQRKEYTPQGSIGTKYEINDWISAQGEIILHHLSNASEAERNGGSNGVGALIGVSIDIDEAWRRLFGD